MKKTIIVGLLVLCLGMSLVSAITIQDFLRDMKVNPGNYYILHNRGEPEMIARIQTFAGQFGVPASNTFIPSKNFIVISVIDNDFGAEYVYGSATSYVRLNVEPAGFPGVNYMEIYLTIEDGYEDYFSTLSQYERDRLDLDGGGDVSYYEVLYDYLDVILDYLEAYQITSIEKNFIEAASGQIIEERTPPTCAEFSSYDRSVWYKDIYLYKGFVLEDLCSGNILSELTCMSDGNVNYEFWTCPRGCSEGRCIYTVFFLIYQYDKGDISYGNFNDALNAWIDVPI